MEDDLDDIVAQKIEWIEALKEFYAPFEKALAEAEVKMEKIKKEIQTKEICPECGKPVVIRQGRYGDFMACSGYPKCKFTKPLPGTESKEEVAEEACEKCGGKMILKHSRYGSFLACSNYPKCKNTKSILKKIDAKCPTCGGDLVERRTRSRRLFYGCINYPKCEFATWQRPGSAKEKPKDLGELGPKEGKDA
ncbi:MAG: topoisomerase DNA-binding C4 zinc finger domain-containing protein, partial [Candidatus Margulisiibacteriota bacterium]